MAATGRQMQRRVASVRGKKLWGQPESELSVGLHFLLCLDVQAIVSRVIDIKVPNEQSLCSNAYS